MDNAAPTENLPVYRTDTGAQVCSVPVLRAGGSGSENSPVGAGNSVFVAGTNGYPYPALPDDAGPSTPASADFKTVRTHYLGTSALYDTLQMVGSIAPGGVIYQGTITGILRITNG